MLDLSAFNPKWAAMAGTWGWIFQVFLVVLAALVLDYFQRRTLHRVQIRLARTPNPWDDALIRALRRPLSLLIWVVGVAFAADLVAAQAEAPIFRAVGPLREVGVIAAITWFLLRLAQGVEANMATRGETEHDDADTPFDRTAIHAIGRLVRLSILITATLVGLQTLGFSVSGVLAFGGIGGIAIGFAAKDLLANFFGGMMIYLDRPFGVGDWIRSPDRDIEGTVEAIGWRLTRIRTFDKRPLYVPNGVFANITVENPSRMSHRRIYETLGVRYCDADKLTAITAAVRDMLVNHPDIAHEQTLMVNVNGFSDSSVDFFVYCFTRTTVWTEYHQVKQDVLLRIEQIIAAHDAQFAFPTTTLDLPERTGNPTPPWPVPTDSPGPTPAA